MFVPRPNTILMNAYYLQPLSPVQNLCMIYYVMQRAL